MIKPAELDSDLTHGPSRSRGRDVWDAICAAAAGDPGTLRRLLERDPNLYRAEHWYNQPVYFSAECWEGRGLAGLVEHAAIAAAPGRRL